MQYYQKPIYYRSEDNRSLLLPILLGAAVGFPFGYIASNTNKPNQVPYYPQPIYQQPIYQTPYMPQPMPYYQPNYYMPY